MNSSNTNPLVVVDGVIYMGGWNDIDPSTIESMSVLKDATSLAVYGSQAANGVVMITTKKGKQGKPVINFNSSLAISNKIMTPKVMRPDVFVEKRNLERGALEGDPSTWMQARNYERWKVGKTTDWWDFTTRTGITQDYSLSVSGASEKFNYFASMAHNDQRGIVIADNFKREVLTAHLQNDITDWLQVGVQAHYSYINTDGVKAGQGSGSSLSPYAEPYRPDGKSLEVKINDVGGGERNPLWYSTYSGYIDDSQRRSTTLLKGHILLKAPWITGLSYRMNIAYSEENTKNDRFQHESLFVEGNDGEDRFTPEAYALLLPQANGYSQRNLVTYYVWDNILNYTAQFGKHYVDATAVYTRDENKQDNRQLNGRDFEAVGNTLLGYNGLHFGAIQTNNVSKSRKANIGYLGRLGYNYNNRYHLTASIRRDGSTVFGDGNKWGIFPAFGAAWTISQEKFMQSLATVNYLKLKASWGKNGNQTLNPYSTLSTIGLGQSGNHAYVFDNNSVTKWGQFINSLGNPNLGWETTTSVNLGFDVGLWDNRIGLEADFYTSKTTEQIFSRTIPVISNGFTSTRATMGQVDNLGLEFTINTVNIKKNVIGWTSMLNFYLNRNKLIDLYGDGKDDPGSSLFLGKSLGAIYGYKMIGIVQEEDADYIVTNNSVAGNPKFANTDNSADGRISPDDRTVLGFRKENFRMNMSHTFTYGSWELYALFTGIFSGGGFGMDINNEAYLNCAGMVDVDEVWWTPANRSNVYPRINFTGGNYTALQSYGYIRLQNLNLAYYFKQQALKNIGIDQLKLHVSVKNLFTITKWDGGDPEARQKFSTMAPNGFDPLQRTVLFGLNISF